MANGFLHQPPNSMPRMTSMWAYVSVDSDGNEGVLGSTFGAYFMPLIACDEVRLKEIAPIAAQIAKQAGMKVKLVQFTSRVEIGEIGKEGQN